MSLVVVGVLVVLLAVLATLQYRWIAQVSEAERTRLEASLHKATVGFCEDFDREITRAFAVFDVKQPGDDEQLSQSLANRLREWRSTATWPNLVKELLVIRHQGTKEVVLLCFEEKQQTLHQCEWDDGLLRIRRDLRYPGRGLPILDGALPGMILAVEGRRAPTVEFPFDRPSPRDHLLVRFDLDFITDTVLPELVETHFGEDGGLAYALTVHSAGRPEEIIFKSGSPASPQTVNPDSAALLFGLRPFGELSGPPLSDPSVSRQPPPRRRPQLGNRPPRQDGARPGLPPRDENGRWVLEVRHPAGSLENVVASARRRNMLISLATLTMLGITALLMMLSTRRAQRLARQQMDFVATISHELRTPLTAIRSAGQNLADGIIDEPARVRSYGQLIEREGRRLTEMIGRVLTFAGIRSGRQAFRMEIVDLPGIVEAALADCRWTLDERGFEVDTAIEPEFPPVKGDAGALRLVINNLIDNAIKYGASGRWLGVHGGLDAVKEPGEVWISISDRGPGIPRRERKLLFEPFRRGADAASGTVPGSGLGLAVVRGVVEAHGGRIDVSSNSGTGTTFTIRLPAMRAESKQEEGQ
jgi:two-component system sensor histidine kinase SenX3